MPRRIKDNPAYQHFVGEMEKRIPDRKVAVTPARRPETWRYHLGTKYPTQTFKEGDRVGYTRYFIKQLGVSPTDDMWRRAGTVVEVTDVIIGVRWDDEPDKVSPIGASNIAKHGTAAWAD